MRKSTSRSKKFRSFDNLQAKLHALFLHLLEDFSAAIFLALSSCSVTKGVSESKVCAGHGRTEPKATDENATRNVVMKSLLVTLTLVVALIVVMLLIVFTGIDGLKRRSAE